MRKKAFIPLVVIVAAFTGLNAQTLLNSPHDFSGKSWNIMTNTCAVCHTKEEGTKSSLKSTLWDHNYKTTEYKIYQSNTLDAVVGQPTGISKLCLSCHDGTIALNNFGGSIEESRYIKGKALLGTDLSDNHPVSFVYDSHLALVDGELYDPASTESGLGKTIQKDLLVDNQLHCTSCHDVHNMMGNDNLLVKGNKKSSLCLTCHIK